MTYAYNAHRHHVPFHPHDTPFNKRPWCDAWCHAMRVEVSLPSLWRCGRRHSGPASHHGWQGAPVEISHCIWKGV
jgi:hypothetical protein